MKRFISILIVSVLFAIPAIAQDSTVVISQTKEAPKYALYKTDNMWTFIKLDTQTGRMWQVQWSLDNPDEMF